MKQSNKDIGNIFTNALEQHSMSVSFESVWKNYDTRIKNSFRLNKFTIVPLIALLTSIVFFTAGFAAYNIMRNIDKTDYPFVDDKRVIGKWESVDFVKNINSFVPENRSWKEDFFLTSLVFINEGKMLSALMDGNLSSSILTWTKDMIINKQEKTASKYIVKEVNGTSYMFFEWKSGDYIFRNKTPYYYVLKKVDNNDYSNYQNKRVNEDKIDYPFTDDTQIKGKWESVDFVNTIDSFKPEVKSLLDDLFLKELNFEENGKLTITTINSTLATPSIVWTKGLIIDKENLTASKCEIKEIDGIKYMFFEWKTGDYIYRDMKPCYYVLKKAD